MNLEKLLETARLVIEEDYERIETPASNRLDVYLKHISDLVPIVTGLRVKRLGYLSAITGLDLGIESENLEVLYHFCAGEAIVTLRVIVPKAYAWVPSLVEIIPSAEPFERELKEMFGVKVVGLRNPDSLYLPDHWVEDCFPLRKDCDPQKVVKEEMEQGV